MFQPGGSIRAVLFDAVGTLIRPEPGVAEAYLTAARRLSVDGGLTETEVDRRFRTAFARQEAMDRDTGWVTDEFREWRRWQTIVHEVFGEAASQAGLFDELWNHFADVKNWAVDEAVRSAMVAAREFGLLVGIASNFDDRLRRIIATIEGICDLRRVYVSSEVGHRKPSLAFFRAVEAMLNCRPQHVLLVGDDPKHDIEAAQAAGWSAVRRDANQPSLASRLEPFRFDPLDAFVE